MSLCTLACQLLQRSGTDRFTSTVGGEYSLYVLRAYFYKEKVEWMTSCTPCVPIFTGKRREWLSLCIVNCVPIFTGERRE